MLYVMLCCQYPVRTSAVCLAGLLRGVEVPADGDSRGVCVHSSQVPCPCPPSGVLLVIRVL